MKRTLHLTSLGCEKNLMDSERALGVFGKHGYQMVEDPRSAQIILVNTCGFIGPAIEESLEAIAELSKYKQIGICQYLIVSGCLSQRYLSELPNEFPEVDLFLGTRDYARLDNLIPLMKKGKSLEDRVLITQPYFRKQQAVQKTPEAFLKWEDALPRSPSGLTHTGYVKISEGCNKRCTFCTIPLIRGDLISRSPKSIVQEIKQLEASGLKEVHLIAQDLNDYGMEWQNGPSLEDLLDAILKETSVSWIKLHYLYPDRISDRLIELMAKEERLCRYIDMPIQHISNRVLKRMGRKHSREDTVGILNRLFSKIPDLSFRTTLITGFPGETLEDHQELVSFLKEGWVEHMGVFSYYHESSSSSYKFEDDVPHEEKKRRKLELESVQSEIMTRKLSEKYIGHPQLCIIDGPHPETDLLLKGRLKSQAFGVDSHVMINEGQAQQGDIVNVLIHEVQHGNLIGKIVSC